jgi:SprT protein
MQNDVKKTITQHVEICYLIAEEQLRHVFPRPEVLFTQRGRIAGSAHLRKNELRLNPILLEQNKTQFMDEIVPHEICHLLAYQLYGRVKPHGIEWKALMKNLYGLPGKATHNMDVSSVSQATVPYHCACGPVSLTIRRHNKTLKGVQYFCRRCKTQLKPSLSMQ